jgi:ATP-dependent HslUV protease ATP-binding subunit HslU
VQRGDKRVVVGLGIPSGGVPGGLAVHLDRGPEQLERLTEVAWSVNERTENIGARRLYTVMERLLEEVSFTAGSTGGARDIRIDAAYVDGRLTELVRNEDLSRYVL